MLTGIDAINWDKLHHAYGKATDFPELLSQLESDDEIASSKAIGLFFGNIYHQGTRWEASAYTIPFLFDLLDNKDTKNRVSILNLILHLALGNDCLRVETLPFYPDEVFKVADELPPFTQMELTNKLYDESIEFEGKELDLLNNLAVQWARDCYQQVEGNFDRFCRLIKDDDIEVAKLAVCSIPWFPKGQADCIEPLLSVLQQDNPLDLQSTAILTVGLLPFNDERLLNRLAVFADSKGSFYLRLTSIIALINAGKLIPAFAKEVLIEAEAERPKVNEFGNKIPFERPLIGFVANARRRLESREPD